MGFARAVRVGAVLLLAGLVVTVTAEPAAAHGIGGVDPSNYETRIETIEPAVEGVTVRPRDLGDRLELRNTSDAEVVVLGYEDEPYLRIGPDGVFENANSPAVFLNRDRYTTESAPPEYDASAPVEWRRVSGGDTATWHDHRAHWMQRNDPPQVRDEPGRTHVVIEEFEVPLEVDGEPVVVRGDVLWVPGPSAVPWLLLALGLAAAVVLGSRTRVWRWVLAAALALLVVAELAHVVGLWNGTTGDLGAKVATSAYSVAGIVVGTVALVWLTVRRDPYDATPAVLVAAIVLTVAGALADLSTLWSSQLPTTLPDGLARLGVTVALGVGTGSIVAAALRLRPPRRAREPLAEPPERPLHLADR